MRRALREVVGIAGIVVEATAEGAVMVAGKGEASNS